MARPDRIELLKGFLIALTFIAVGLFLRWAGAPTLVAWLPIGSGALGIAVITYRVIRPMQAPGHAGQVTLRDGREYRVEATDTGFTRTDKATGDVRAMDWSDVGFVSIVAIDNFPVGGISFMIHPRAGSTIEVPWDAEGGSAFMNMMQDKLPGFDNMAVVQASGMLHGFRQVWPREQVTEA